MPDSIPKFDDYLKTVAPVRGTVAQRNNNPGNLRPVGGSGFQSFSTPEEGFNATVRDLTGKMTGRTRTGLHGGSTLRQLFHVWAPATDGGNDPEAYAQNVAARLKVSPDTPIGTLLPRVNDLAQAIATQEGYYGAKNAGRGSGAVQSTQGTPTEIPKFEDFAKTQGAEPVIPEPPPRPISSVIPGATQAIQAARQRPKPNPSLTQRILQQAQGLNANLEQGLKSRPLNIPGVNLVRQGVRPKIRNIADLKRVDEVLMPAVKAEQATEGMNAMGPIEPGTFIANKQANDVTRRREEAIRDLIRQNVEDEVAMNTGESRTSAIRTGRQDEFNQAVEVATQARMATIQQALNRHPELSNLPPQELANKARDIADLESDPSAIRTIRRGAWAGAGGIKQKLGNVVDVANKLTSGVMPQSTDARDTLRSAGQQEALTAQLSRERHPEEQGFMGSLGEGVGNLAFAAGPELVLTAPLEALQLPVLGAVGAEDQGLGPMAKAAVLGYVYHKGMGYTAPLGRVGNALIWTAAPALESKVENPEQTWGQAIGSSLPMGALAAVGGGKPVEVRDGKTTRPATVEDLQAVKNGKLEIVPPESVLNDPSVQAVIERNRAERAKNPLQPKGATIGEQMRSKGQKPLEVPATEAQLSPEASLPSGAAAGVETSPQAAQTPKKYRHLDFGDVTEAENQKGVPEGSVRVFEDKNPGAEHIILRSNGRGQGNNRAIPVRGENVGRENAGQVEGNAESGVLPVLQRGGSLPVVGEGQNAEALAPNGRQARQEAQSTEGQLSSADVGSPPDYEASFSQSLKSIPDKELRQMAVNDVSASRAGDDKATRRAELIANEEERRIREGISTSTLKSIQSPKGIIEQAGLKYLGEQETGKGKPPAHLFNTPDGSTLMIKGEVTPESVRAKVEAHQERLQGQKKVEGKQPETGKPIVVSGHHGTRSPIEEFNPEFLGVGTQARSAKKAFFFASSKDLASDYADMALPDAALKARQRIAKLEARHRELAKGLVDAESYRRLKPQSEALQAEIAKEKRIVGEALLARGRREELGGLKGDKDVNVLSRNIAFKNPLVVDFKGKPFREETYSNIIDRAKKQGHDGVIFRNTFDPASSRRADRPTDVYAVFDSKQIQGREKQTTSAVPAVKINAVAPENIRGKVNAETDPNINRLQRSSLRPGVATSTAEATSPKVRATPKSLESAGLEKGSDLTYDPITNKETLDSAKRSIRQKGLDASRADLVQKKELSAEDTATGVELIRQYQAKGDMERAADVASHLSKKLTEAGQAVQAASVISRLSPEGVILTAQRQLKSGEKLTPEQSKGFVEDAAKVREAEAKISTLEKQLVELQMKANTRAPRPKLETLQERLQKAEQDARARLAARIGVGKGTQTGASTIPLDIADYAIIGASKLAQKGVTFAKWSSDMISEFGEDIKPKLRSIYRESYKQYDETRKALLQEQRERSVRRENVGPLRPEDTRKLINERLDAQTQLRKARQDLLKRFDDLNASRARTFGRRVVDALGLPRALETTFDLSWGFRQGKMALARHPLIWGRGFVKQIQALSHAKFERLVSEIETHPEFKYAKRFKLGLTSEGLRGENLGAREETYQTSLASKIPGVGASERAQTMMGDAVKFGWFLDYLGRAKKAGFDPEKSEDKAVFQQGVDLINDFTGRGKLPRSVEGAAPVLNNVLFSPRFWASRLRSLTITPARMVLPEKAGGLTRPARVEAFKTLFTFSSLVAGQLALAKMTGASVTLNPFDPKFGKACWGNECVDFTAGFQSHIRTAIGLEQAIQGKGKRSAIDILGTYARGKESPLASTVHDLFLSEKDKEGRGKDVTGQPVNLTGDPKKTGMGRLTSSYLFRKMTPMIFNDAIEAYDDAGLGAGIGVGAASLLGEGATVYEQRETKGTRISAPRTQIKRVATVRQ